MSLISYYPLNGNGKDVVGGGQLYHATMLNLMEKL